MKRRHIIIISICVSILIIIALLSTWLYLKKIDALPVKKVDIVGNFDAIGKARISKLVMPSVMHGMFNVDADSIRKALKQFPSIQSVDISHDWLHTIIVSIKRYPLFARFENNIIATPTGIHFKPTLKANIDQLPIIDFPITKFKFAKKQFDHFSQIIQPAGLVITQLSQDSADQWILTVKERFSGQAGGEQTERQAEKQGNNSQVQGQNKQIQTPKSHEQTPTSELRPAFEIMCGNVNVDERLKRFIKAYPQLILEKPTQHLAYVDLRYKTGIAVQWQKNDKKHR